jgi:hypothetical protein
MVSLDIPRTAIIDRPGLYVVINLGSRDDGQWKNRRHDLPCRS